jgi:hypothetical protein
VSHDEDPKVAPARAYIQQARSSHIEAAEIRSRVVEGSWMPHDLGWSRAYIEIWVGEDLRLSLPPDLAATLVEQVQAALVAYAEGDHSPTPRTV